MIGHRDAIALIEELSQSKSLVQAYEIRQIHALLMRGISREEAGQYRRILVRSAGTGDVYPAPRLLEGLMAEFVDWLMAPSALHPLKFATEAHLRFVSMHPFRDGNERTGRLLMNLLLMQVGFPIVVIPNARRLDYITAIVAYQQQQMGIEPLLDLVVDGAIESLN